MHSSMTILTPDEVHAMRSRAAAPLVQLGPGGDFTRYVVEQDDGLAVISHRRLPMAHGDESIESPSLLDEPCSGAGLALRRGAAVINAIFGAPAPTPRPMQFPVRSGAGVVRFALPFSRSIGSMTCLASRASSCRSNRFPFPCPLERLPQETTMNLTPKQLRIYELVRQWRNDRGYSPTMQELADELGVSKVTVFEHVQALVEKGVLSRNPNKARSLALTVDDELPAVRATPSTDALTLPLLGRIAAGHPVEKFEQDETLSLGQVFGPARGRHNEMFALQVEGMSMRDESILDGDYVIVERRSTARNGDRVVALLPNGETTLKTFFRERDGRIRLQPANPEFEPIIVDECQVQGIVIGVMRRY